MFLVLVIETVLSHYEMCYICKNLLCYLTIALFIGLFIIFIIYDFVFINIVIVIIAGPHQH